MMYYNVNNNDNKNQFYSSFNNIGCIFSDLQDFPENDENNLNFENNNSNAVRFNSEPQTMRNNTTDLILLLDNS